MEIAIQKGCRKRVKHGHFKQRIPLEEGAMPWKFY